MHKDKLLYAICLALGLDEHVHHNIFDIAKKRWSKTESRRSRRTGETTLKAGDHVQLKQVRRKMHRMKRHIHKATV